MLTTSGMATEGAVAGSGDNPVFTLSDEQLERIVGLMYTTFQPQIAQVAKDSFQSQISDLVTTIVVVYSMG